MRTPPPQRWQDFTSSRFKSDFNIIPYKKASQNTKKRNKFSKRKNFAFDQENPKGTQYLNEEGRYGGSAGVITEFPFMGNLLDKGVPGDLLGAGASERHLMGWCINRARSRRRRDWNDGVKETYLWTLGHLAGR